MKITKRLTNWLETNASAPTYGGWVLAGVSVSYLGAAINTMTGWLYVISGVSLAILGLSIFSAPRLLKNLVVKRFPIPPITAGDELSIEIEIHNPTQKPVSLLLVSDTLPFVLGEPTKQPIDIIEPEKFYRWHYYQPTQRRGIYKWLQVELATGAPWGLFWCRRQRECPAIAIVYPTVLPLSNCPLVDEIGQDDSQRNDPRGKPLQLATSGLVRSLRPYRIGDPTRLIHWRTSARYGELRVRELELITGGQEVIIALDTAAKWDEEQFEQAVIAAASLYFYAQRQELQVQLWTAATGVVKGDVTILEALAATNPLEEDKQPPETSPLIWLTQNPLTLSNLPADSRWVLWQDPNSSAKMIVNQDYSGIILDSEQELQLQLQKPLASF
ncbi:DUF58 domain-containing protein [Okeanomitos corallinicola TIOX110]|uniref:DUF58 domain-containing protein n=1 Tax=Okeanomitos corallinicola TIOX110 TaxID=3133117 RepID=A0ABZ2UWC8_9CYAN